MQTLQTREKGALAVLFFVAVGFGYVALGPLIGGSSEAAGLNRAAAKFAHNGRQSAACYGTATLCAALLSAHGPEEFQKVANLQSGTPSRHLYAVNPMPTRTAAGATHAVGVNRFKTPVVAQEARSPMPNLRSSVSAQGAPTNAVRSQSKRVPALQMSVGLYYSTSTGNTETVAGYIAEKTGIEDWKDIADADEAEILGHEAIIVGAPTWHTGSDVERSGTSWDEWLYQTLPNMDFTGKKVAIFGVGDSGGYADNFCDATGELYDCFTKQGATIIGMTPEQDGIEYEETKSVRDGKFVGKMFDEDGYSDESEQRADDWVNQLKGEGFPM